MLEMSPELALVAPAHERELLLAALPRRDPNAFLLFPAWELAARPRRGRLALGVAAYLLESAFSMALVGVAVVGALAGAIVLLELVR
jgi:hypothetical protein